MRLHDMLMTETPRPEGRDKPFTDYATWYEEAVVIDATDVAEMLLDAFLAEDDSEAEMRMAKRFGDRGDTQETAGYQAAKFFHWDSRMASCVAPPFSCFVIEMDIREAMERSARNIATLSQDMSEVRRSIAHVGKYAVVFRAFDRDLFFEKVAERDVFLQGFLGRMLRDEAATAKWIYITQVFRYIPGKGMVGPDSTWCIPVKEDGTLFMQVGEDEDDGENVMIASIMPPHADDDDEAAEFYIEAMATGWTAVIPALMAINFMHTPAGPKGYHELEENLPNPRLAKKFLQRNFRPLTKFYRLDITNLRAAIRQANGGEPTGLSGWLKALHVVRGHTATYMPNTYFGRKHPNPITVFRPSFRRGDVKAGVISKDYALASTNEENT